MPLNDIWIGPHEFAWPADQLPDGIERHDLLTLAPWPKVDAQHKVYDWRKRFTYQGETSNTP